MLGIGMNKIHTKHTASGKCFGQKFQRQKSDATSLTQTSTKQSQDADFVKEKRGIVGGVEFEPSRILNQIFAIFRKRLLPNALGLVPP